MKISAIRIDSAKADAGVTVRLDTYDGRFEDAWVRVRAWGNKDDLRIVDRQNRLHRGQMTPDVAYARMTQRMSGAILIGWGGFTDDSGAEVPYSKEKAEEWLADKDFALFRAAVARAADDVTSGDAKGIEDDAGN